jgi:hypothetical protein
MKYFIFDIETNGLTLEQVTKIHCLSFLEIGVPGAKVRTITDYGQMKRFFTQKDVCIIGHNIWTYDIPTAEYILDFEIDPTSIRVIDTLALSWYLFEDRPKHGLEQWGEDLGIKKVEVKDWNTDDIKLYTFRCEEDVKITKLLLDACNKKLKDLYGASTKRAEVADYLSFKMYCYYIAQKHPLKLDIEKVDATLELIENKLEETKLALESQMPLVPAYATKSKPKNCYKKDGNLSKHGEAWFELLKSSGLPEDHEEDVKYIKGYDPPSYTSSQQVKEWLFSLGWEPTEFKQGANGDVPQVRIEDEDGAKILAPCVRKLIKIAPQIEYLEELGVLAHRKGILKGFLSSVDSEGCIRADIGGLTTTLRVKHRTLVNLPGVKRAWGADVRGCLIAPDGYELAGSDVSGLEDTTKRHYIFPYDEEYVKEQMAPGFDAHCDIAIRAKLMTEADVQFYKAFKKVSGAIEAGQTPDPELVSIVTAFCPEEEKQYKLFQKLDAQRFKGKTTNFSSTYKVGAKKLGSTLDIPKREAQKILDAFWKRNWAITAFEKDLVVKSIESPQKVVKEQLNRENKKEKVSYFVNKSEDWVLNPMNGFWYKLRSQKDRFSAINQSTGAFCFDMWMKNIIFEYKKVAAQFHDELIAIIPQGHRQGFRDFLTKHMDKVNEDYELNTPLRVDVNFGFNYADVH